MKKLTKGLALLFSGFAVQTFAALLNPVPHYCVNIPGICGGTTFGLTAYFWHPSIPATNYALVYPSTTRSGETIFQEGIEQRIRPDYTWGLGVNVGYVFPCSGDDVRLSLLHINRDSSRLARDPDDGNLLPSVSDTWRDGFLVGASIPPITGVVGGATVTLLPSHVIFPPRIHADLVVAKTSFDYLAFDLDYGRQMNIGRYMRVRLHGGLRYADLENNLNVTILGNRSTTVSETATNPAEAVPSVFNFSESSSVTEVVNQKSYFSGIGPRIGLDLSYALLCRFGIVAGMSSGAIIGTQHAKLLEEFHESALATLTGLLVGDPTTSVSVSVGNTFNTPVDATGRDPDSLVIYKSPRISRVVPNIDAKLGVNYTFKFCKCPQTQVNVEAGWMATEYFNLIERTSLIAGRSPEFRSRQTFNMGFQGPYIGVQVKL